MLKKNVQEKMLLQKQKKKNNENQKGNNSRFLITVTVLGSAGPIRFVVNEDDLVAGVIDTALKAYAREGRLPVLGSDANKFLLYSANSGSDALSQWERIGRGSGGGRNFVMCKKEKQQMQMSEGRSEIVAQKGSGGWKAWLNRSFNFKILSH